MKHRLGKFGAAFLALALALAVTGAGFAAWTDAVTIQGTVNTGDVEWELQDPITNTDLGRDWNCFYDLETGTWTQMDKDVGSTALALEATDHPHSMTVTINNAYPYYGNHIAFKVHGLGSIPLRIWKVEVWNDGTLVKTLYANGYVYLDLDGKPGDDLEIWWGNNFGDQLHFCDKYDISFELLVLQPAPQNASLSFTIKLFGIQWNEYSP